MAVVRGGRVRRAVAGGFVVIGMGVSMWSVAGAGVVADRTAVQKTGREPVPQLSFASLLAPVTAHTTAEALLAPRTWAASRLHPSPAVPPGEELLPASQEGAAPWPVPAPWPAAVAVPDKIASLLPPAVAGVRVLRSLPTKESVVSLTFDVESGPAAAISILDTLKKDGIRASFGLTGQFASANPAIVRRIVTEGHDIFNHTNSHPSFTAVRTVPTALTTADRQRQLREMEQALRAVVERPPLPVFRPPYGNYDDTVLRDIADAGYPWMLLWNVDAQGFRNLAPSEIVRRSLAQAHSGSIILLHGIAPDAAALPGLVAGLKARGYSFVTVGDALHLK